VWRPQSTQLHSVTECTRFGFISMHRRKKTFSAYSKQKHSGMQELWVCPAKFLGFKLAVLSSSSSSSESSLQGTRYHVLLLLLQIRTRPHQPHLGCCLATATAAASAIFMHLCTNSANPCTSRQHMRSCNDVNGNCANRRSRLITAVAGHERSRWASSSTGRSCIPKAAHRLQPRTNQTTP
jgi:hypothetical protein